MKHSKLKKGYYVNKEAGIAKEFRGSLFIKNGIKNA